MYISEDLYPIINVLVILYLLISILKGFTRGFLYEVISISFILLSFVVAWFLSPIFTERIPLFKMDLGSDIANTVYETTNMDLMMNNINNDIWIIIIVFGLNIIFMIVKPLFKIFSKLPVVGAFNKVLGVILGILRGYVICLLMSFFLTLPLVINGKDVKENTLLKYTDNVSNLITKRIMKNVDLDDFKEEIKNFDVNDSRNELTEWLIEQGVLDE